MFDININIKMKLIFIIDLIIIHLNINKFKGGIFNKFIEVNSKEIFIFIFIIDI